MIDPCRTHLHPEALFVVSVGGPTDIEDFLEFIDHPETHNELQGMPLFLGVELNCRRGVFFFL